MVEEILVIFLMEKHDWFLRRSPPHTSLAFPGVAVSDLAASLMLTVNKKEFPCSPWYYIAMKLAREETVV